MTPLEDWQPTKAAYRAGAPLQPRRPVMTDAQLAQQSSRKLYVRLPRPRLQECTDMLAKHPGAIPVYLHIP